MGRWEEGVGAGGRETDEELAHESLSSTGIRRIERDREREG